MDTVDVEDAVDKALEQAVDELRQALVAIGEEATHGELSFWEVEKRFSAVIVVFARQVLAVLLSLYDIGAKYIEYEDEIWRRGTEKKPKSYHSIWGPVPCPRWVYLRRGESAGEQLVPLEKKAGLIGGKWTPHCAEAITRLVQSVPTREAVENMETVGVLPYSRSGFDNVVQMVGERWESERHDLEQEVIEAVDIPDKAVGISVAYDRACMPMDETEPDPEAWPNGRKQPRTINGRMTFCATVTLHDEDGESLWTRRYARLARKPEGFDGPGVGEWEIREQVKWDVDTLINRALNRDENPVDLSKRACVLTDGGPELERVAENDFREWIQLCDVRHLGGYLSGALEERGYSEAQRIIERREWIEHLKRHDDGIEDIEARLLDWDGQEDGGIDAALTYIGNRRNRLTGYASAYRQGLPIGSGHVEATCKSLIEMRMRRPGARWTKQTATAILNFRSLALSKTWNEGMQAVLKRFEDRSIERCDRLCQAAA